MALAIAAPSIVLDRSAVHVRLLRLFASPVYRPPLLPGVAHEIIALSGRPDVALKEVAGVLEHDPVLATKVLSIAQSAMYRSRTPVLSLHQATVRLGLATLRSVVIEASLAIKVFDAPGYEAAMARLSWHSTVTAYLMRAFASEAKLDAEYAFLCGLLHDVGIAACLLALADDGRGRALPFDALEPVLDAVHQEASGVVTRLWGIPSAVQQLTATHHQLHVGGTPHPVNALLIVTEHLAAELDGGMSPWSATPPGPGERVLDRSAPGLFEAACGVLSLQGPAIEAARRRAAEVIAGLSAHPALRLPEPRR